MLHRAGLQRTNRATAGNIDTAGLSSAGAQPERNNQVQLIRTIVWVLVTAIVALFAARNWGPVTINLWGDLQMETRLALVVLASFLLGFLPMLLLHRTSRWTLKRKLAYAERALAEARPEPIAFSVDDAGQPAPAAQSSSGS